MDILVLVHSLLRWVLLFLIVFNIVNAWNGMKANKPYTAQDNKLNLFMMIITDVQLLIGLVLYIAGQWGIKNIQAFGMGDVMKNTYTRFFAIEHIFGMLIAIVLIHIGRSKMKKRTDDNAKHKAVFVFTLIALIIMLATIPWPFREVFASRGWI